MYVDIMTGENLSSIQLDNLDLIYFVSYSYIRRGRDGVKGGIVILASCEHPFIKVLEYFVQHLIYNILIIVDYVLKLTEVDSKSPLHTYIRACKYYSTNLARILTTQIKLQALECQGLSLEDKIPFPLLIQRLQILTLCL